MVVSSFIPSTHSTDIILGLARTRAPGQPEFTRLHIQHRECVGGTAKQLSALLAKGGSRMSVQPPAESQGTARIIILVSLLPFIFSLAPCEEFVSISSVR